MEKKTKKLNAKKTTTAKDWLDMDLKSQSGSLWTDEKSASKNYENPKFTSSLLGPDPIRYGGKEFPSKNQLIE